MKAVADLRNFALFHQAKSNPHALVWPRSIKRLFWRHPWHVDASIPWCMQELGATPCRNMIGKPRVLLLDSGLELLRAHVDVARGPESGNGDIKWQQEDALVTDPEGPVSRSIQRAFSKGRRITPRTLHSR